MSESSRTPVVVPTIGESIKTAFIAQWFKKVGDTVREGEALLEVDSDKATLEVPSPSSGTVVEILAEEGDEVQIGAPVAVLVAGEGANVVPEVVPEAPAQGGKGPQTGPAARQAAAEKGVDIGQVTGTGVRGRVLAKDVAAAAPTSTASIAPAPIAAAPAADIGVAVAAPIDDGSRVERVPMTPLRRTIARRLVEAQHTAAMLTTFNEIDMSRVMALRSQYQDVFVKKYGMKLGFMSVFVKGVIEALKTFPAVNAEIDNSDPNRPVVVYKHYYNIGVAVSTNRGLMVPVVRDADRLSLAETEGAIAELANRGRDGALKLDDFKDGTFTISNGGVFGSLMSTPILNPPQVGILGMHSIQRRPIAVGNAIEIRPMMYVALSYDHRIIDGREAVGFLVRVKECVENPERILLEV